MNLEQILLKNYQCNCCDYNTVSLKDFNKHILTPKHKNRTNLEQKSSQIPNAYVCKTCNKIYKARNSLWYHEKKCAPQKDNETIDKDSLIMMLIKQNAELIKEQSDMKNMVIEQNTMVLEILKNGTNNTTITQTNSHNKAFNLNFFLNETCKNAMNITDFIDSIKLQLPDLIDIGEKGYVEGISDIIVKSLKNLDETERPVHCVDKKREICYIKDANKWEKDENNNKIKHIVKKVSYKNERLLPLFKQEYPDYNDSESSRSDQYSKIVIEAMGGADGDTSEKEDKIVRNITKATVIKKCL